MHGVTKQRRIEIFDVLDTDMPPAQPSREIDHLTSILAQLGPGNADLYRRAFRVIRLFLGD